MPFIGNQPAESYSAFQKQDFSTSATTSYTLDNPVTNANELALFINFVRQEPTAAYSASGTSLTLTSATASSDDMYCVYLGKAVQTVNPPNASVGTNQLVDGSVTSAKLSEGKILQVVSTTKTDVFTASATDTWHDVTGLTASITPSSTSSKILVTGHVMGSSQNSGAARRFYIKLLRGSTAIGLGDASSSRLQVHNSSFSDNGANNATVPINFLDTPSSTSALTYKIQVRDDTDGVRVNAAPGDSDSDTYPRAVSTITLMEVSG